MLIFENFISRYENFAPSAEATSWAQCATPTDVKVNRTSWKFLHTKPMNIIQGV